jgi:RNAse (barnase) inhibitor barstar
MYTTDAFEFTAAAPDRVDVVLDQSVRGKQGLLDRFAQDLSFPVYFGRNWDALIDCLSDLSWVQAPEVVIDHAAVPQLLSSDLRLYLESLIDSADRRGTGRAPRLRILFRVVDRNAIEAALGA